MSMRSLNNIREHANRCEIIEILTLHFRGNNNKDTISNNNDDSISEKHKLQTKHVL